MKRRLSRKNHGETGNLRCETRLLSDKTYPKISLYRLYLNKPMKKNKRSDFLTHKGMFFPPLKPANSCRKLADRRDVHEAGKFSTARLNLLTKWEVQIHKKSDTVIRTGRSCSPDCNQLYLDARRRAATRRLVSASANDVAIFQALDQP